MRTFPLAAVLLTFTTCPSLLAQQVAVLTPVADNTLYESATGATSNGAGPGLFIGTTAPGLARRAVMRFDVAAALPAGAKVLGATLELNVVQSNTLTASPAFGHRLVLPWGEGTSTAGPVGPGGGGNGAPSTTNDATWIHTFFPTSNWTTPGGDFLVSPSFAITMPLTGSTTSATSNEAAADVQAWLDHPNVNYGWIVIGDETIGSTARKIDSRESPSGQPRLTITYLAPGQAGTWGTGCAVGAGTFDLNVLGTPSGGNTITWQFSGAPNNQVGILVYGLELDRVGISTFAPCPLHVNGPTLVTAGLFFTNGSGDASATFAVPNGFPGVLVTSQGAALTGAPNGIVFSNAGALCLQ